MLSTYCKDNEYELHVKMFFVFGVKLYIITIFNWLYLCHKCIEYFLHLQYKYSNK